MIILAILELSLPCVDLSENKAQISNTLTVFLLSQETPSFFFFKKIFFKR